MKKRFLLTSLLLGITFDYFFWEKAPGISFAIYVVLCLAGGYLLLRWQNIRQSKKSLVLLAPIFFFSAMTFIRLEPLTLLLNYALTLFCMAVLVIDYRSGQWPVFSFSDYIIRFGFLISNMVNFSWTQLFNQASNQNGTVEDRKSSKIWPIVRGIVITLPILFVFGALFSSADLIFAKKLGNLGALLSLENLGEYIFRGVYILLIAYLLAGVFNTATKEITRKDKPVLTPFLGFVESAIILGSILALFSAFVLVQFQYFFSGQANISLDGLTYSEYARRGFGELVAVASLSLFLIQVLTIITKRRTVTQKKVFSGLGVGLVALVIVILVSSFQRLTLYEAAYGFTRSRAYAHVFIIWLGILLLTVMALEVLNRQHILAAAALIILVGFIVSLNLLNVDAFIARQNIHLADNGKQLDTTYLSSLSNDAVPTLIEGYNTPNQNPETKNSIEAVLVCMDLKQKAALSQTQSWSSFNLSNWNAFRGLQILEGKIKGYHVQDDTYPLVITSPTGMEYTCAYY